MDNKKLNIEFSEQFLLDLDAILNYINCVLKNLYATEKLYKEIMYKLEQIRTFPDMCEIYGGVKNKSFIWRKMRVKNYVIFYTVLEDTIKVERIIYNRRNSKEMFLEEKKEVYIAG